MSDASLSSDGQKINIHLDENNSEFSDYLKFGLEFEEKSKNSFEKEYGSETQLIEDLSQIYYDAQGYSIKLKLDTYCSTIIDSIKKGSIDLKNSLEEGLKIKNSDDKNFEPADNFYRIPTDFQIKSISHILSTSHSANFSVPGSGKTMISLAAYAKLKEKGVVDSLLVVGPISSFAAWEEEFNLCFKKSPISGRISGDQIMRRLITSRPQDFDVILVSYHMLKFEEKNIEEMLKKRKFFMVLDESHHIKSQDGLHASIVCRLANHAKKRLILSGTPVPNNIKDLWTQFTFLYPNKELLWSKGQYEDVIVNRPREIKDRINPLFVRITKDELAIPKPRINRIKVKLDKDHYEFYYELARSIVSIAKSKYGLERKEFFKVCIAWVLQSIDDPNILAVNPKVRHLLDTSKDLKGAFVKFQENSIPKKVYYVEDAIKQLIKADKKVLFWTYFVDNIEILSQEKFKAFNPLLIYGAIPKDDNEDEELNREKEIRIFKTDPNRKLLIANPAACAESISLHMVCKDAIYLDRTYNCAQYLQSLDRIHRLGIKQSPEIKIYLGENTLDEVVDSRLEEKREIMLELLDDPFKPIDLETQESDLFGELNERMRGEADKDLRLFEEELNRVVKE